MAQGLQLYAILAPHPLVLFFSHCVVRHHLLSSWKLESVSISKGIGNGEVPYKDDFGSRIVFLSLGHPENQPEDVRVSSGRGYTCMGRLMFGDRNDILAHESLASVNTET